MFRSDDHLSNSMAYILNKVELVQGVGPCTEGGGARALLVKGLGPGLLRW